MKYLKRIHPMVYLSITWVLIQLLFYELLGIRASVDTKLYLNKAHSLLSGDLPSGQIAFYSSFIIILSLLLKLGLSVYWLSLIQVIIAFIAFHLQYKIVDKLSGRVAAILSSVFFLLWFKFFQWNLILYTDALFTHCVVICCYFLIAYKKPYKWVMFSLIFVFTLFIRPNGLFLIPSIICYFIFRNYKSVKPHYGKIVAIALFGIFVVALTSEVFMSESLKAILESYKAAEIIYPDRSLGVQPLQDYKQSKNELILLQIIFFIVEHPLYFLKIFFIKIGLYLAHIKPYYSATHNLYVLTLLLTAYASSIYGFRKVKNIGWVSFSVTFIIIQILTVGITSENWDGRFLLYILPFVFISSGIGFSQLRAQYFAVKMGKTNEL